MTTERQMCHRPHKVPSPAKARGLCQKHYTQWLRENPAVASDIVAEHIKLLRDCGLSCKSIANVAGVHPKVVAEVADRGYLFADVAARILAIDPASLCHAVATGNASGLNDLAWIPSLGSARRLQALCAMGYNKTQLRMEMGLTPTSKIVEEVPVQRRPFVKIETARLIADTYKRLHRTPPPPGVSAKRAQLRAQRLGWHGPEVWDEFDIDDPDAEPLVDHRLSTTDRVQELLDLGVTGVHEISERLDIKPESVKQALYRMRKAHSDTWIEPEPDQAAAA